jgi:hypothetical protein
MLAAMATDGSTPIGSSRYTRGMEGRLPNHGQPRLGLRNELVLDRQQYIAEGKKLIENSTSWKLFPRSFLPWD